ncbi:hypothetical protein BDP81DRAFT_471092 [Colletotrichum phormii]|uniref:Uncharacterized protein n=1 Tax=Colletotrichum phormii TaxID=359342 RepID=A0AAI9ZTK2_9PEZI|nr:uncharacterized protein BDP81DRAFT_471092 [Colletotrichum phormii]KAK1637873.1 hypothetical protein BDP81DRAFT_471092 [Colletotrichum phormii]
MDIKLASGKTREQWQKLEVTIARAHEAGFSYEKDNGFIYFKQKHWRIGIECLREVFLSEDADPDDEFFVDAHDFDWDFLKDKSWYEAQSNFYGLRLGNVKMKTLRNLHHDMAELVKLGACDSPPKDVAAFKAAFFEMDLTRRTHVEIFNELERLEDQIEFDIDLFIERYFVRDGTPTPHITPEPMVLRNLVEDTRDQLPGFLDSIYGLYHDIVTPDDGDSENYTIIAWSIEALNEAVISTELSWRARCEKAIAEGSVPDDCADEMKKHYNYVFNNLAPPEIEYRIDGKNFLIEQEATLMRLEDALGRFIVKSPGMEEAYTPVDPGPFHLKIRPLSSPVEDDGLLAADMDFGRFTGTMILSFSYDRMATVQSKAAKPTEGYEIINGVDTLWEGLSKMKDFSRDDTKKVIKQALRRAEGPTESGVPQRDWRLSTMRKPNPWFPHSGSRRLYFCSKGVDDKGTQCHKGVLDFNPSCTRFQGLISVNGDLLKLKGYRAEDYSPPQWSNDAQTESEEDGESDEDGESSTSGELSRISI